MDSITPKEPIVDTLSMRETAAGIAKNTSIMLFQQVITMTSSVLLTIFLARYLGPVEYGKLYLAGSIAAIFQILVNYGGNYLIAKEVARARERTASIFVNALAVRLGFAFLSVGLMWAIAAIAGYGDDIRLLLGIYGIGLFVWAAHSSLYASFQGHELLQYTSAGAIAERVFTSAVSIGALLLGAGAFTVAVIILLGIIANACIELWYSKRIFHDVPRIEPAAMLRGLKNGIPYFLFGLFSTVYYRIGTIMLSRMTPEEVVGWFGGAFRFFESLNFPYILTVAIYPVLSRSWTEVSNVHQTTMQKSLAYVVILGVPVSIGSILFASEIVGVFYGMPAYAPSAAVLQVLSGGLIFLYIDMILGTTLLSSDRQKKMVLISAIAIPFNVGLNYLLIPYCQTTYGNGAIGVAVATGLTEVLMMFSMLRVVPKGILAGFPIAGPLKALAAGGVMVAVGLAAQGLGWHWIVAAILSSLAYVGGILAFRTFDAKEWGFVREVVIGRIAAKLMGRV